MLAQFIAQLHVLLASRIPGKSSFTQQIKNENGEVLLHALGARFGVDEHLENGENVAAVIDHAGEDVA